jgi:hypothetical protein
MSNHTSEFEQVVELVFQNVQYLLTVSLAPGDTLCVEAEHKTDGSRWRGDFTARCQFSTQTLPKISSYLVFFTAMGMPIMGLFSLNLFQGLTILVRDVLAS